MPERPTPEKRPSIFDLCPTCLKPKPCIMHDQKFMEELLHREEKPPDFEKTREWEYGNHIYSTQLLEDNRVLLGGIGGIIKILNTKTREIVNMGEYGNTILSTQLLEDNRVLLGGIGGIIKILNTKTGEIVNMGEYGNGIYSTLLLEDNRVLLGGWGGIIKILNTKTREIVNMGEYGDDIHSTRLTRGVTPERSKIFIGGDGGKFQMWEIPEDKLQAYNERMTKIPEVPPLPEY